MTKSVFDSFNAQAYPFKFEGSIEVRCIAGGTPTNPNVAESWLRSKLDSPDDQWLYREIAKVMTERGVTGEEALEQINKNKHLNGFRKDENGLFIEGRHLKANLKEASNVAANAGKVTTKGWGNPDNANYKKGLKSWFPEHVFVVEDRLYLGVEEPTGIMQRFVATRMGTGIQYEEYVENAKFDFTIVTDHEFTDDQWAMIWLTAQEIGVGASRSQGYGRYSVTRWDRVS